MNIETLPDLVDTLISPADSGLAQGHKWKCGKCWKPQPCFTVNKEGHRACIKCGSVLYLAKYWFRRNAYGK